MTPRSLHLAALALALHAAPALATDPYGSEVRKNVSWDNSKHVTFKFVNNISIPIYVKTGKNTCMEGAFKETKIDPLKSFSSQVKFEWTSAKCGTIERLPEGQAPWPISGNTISAELNVATKTSIDKQGTYCGGYFTLWGASLQGHVSKVSFWYGTSADTITYRCKVEIGDDANTVTLTVAPK